MPGRQFWEYHRAGLALLGWKLDWLDVLPWTIAEVLHVLLNPENTLRRALRRRWRGSRLLATKQRTAVQRDRAKNGARIGI